MCAHLTVSVSKSAYMYFDAQKAFCAVNIALLRVSSCLCTNLLFCWEGATVVECCALAVVRLAYIDRTPS